MTNKELFYFTGKCLSLDEHPVFREDIIKRFNDESFSWERFIGMCSNHFILPAIYLKFQFHNLLPFLPEEVSEFMQEIYERNSVRNKQIISQVNDVTRLLNEHEIYPVFLKGTAHILDGLYSDFGERMVGDIDLLVPDKDYLKAAKILEDDGYSSGMDIYFDVEHIKHYPRLFKPTVPADIEVHRLLVSDKHSQSLNPLIVERELKPADERMSSFVLSDRHKVIHNFIHCQLEHQGQDYGIISLRDIYDFYLLSKRVDMNSTISQIHQKRKAIAYFIFCSKALGIPLRFFPHETITSRLLNFKHSLNMNSQVFYYSYRTLQYIYSRMLVGWTVQIFQSIYSKHIRKSVFNRLKNPQWYRDHFKSYRNIFPS